MNLRVAAYQRGTDNIDSEAWLAQLEFLDVAEFSLEVRLVLAAMTAQRLFDTAVVSEKHYDLVAAFLDYLRNHDLKTDSMSGEDHFARTAAPEVDSASEPSLLLNMPTELCLRIVDDLGFADRSRFAQASHHSGALVAVALRSEAARILGCFGLRFADVRLMQTATGAIIAGSAVAALARIDAAFVPADLDFISGKGRGSLVTSFLFFAGGYLFVRTRDVARYRFVAGIGRVTTMKNGAGKMVNIIESVSDNPFDVVGHFHLTCVYGFTIGINEYDSPHTCGEDWSCPATLRTTDDGGCSYSPFPSWKYNRDAVQPGVTCWTLGGTGCHRAMLARKGGAISFVTSMHAPICALVTYILVLTDGELDIAAWLEQLDFLLHSGDAYRKRLVLYTMSAKRLFDTVLISRAHFDVVSEFLEFLHDREPEEDELSIHSIETDSGSDSDMSVSEGQSPALHSDEGIHIGLGDLPADVGLKIMGCLPLADRFRLTIASPPMMDLVSTALRSTATLLLWRFKLRFADVRLLLTATVSLISGSTVAALACPEPTFAPGDLDFFTPSGRGRLVVDFLASAAAYTVTKELEEYKNAIAIGRMWTLHRGDVKINVIESLTSNPFHAVLNFHLTGVIATPVKLPIPHLVPAHINTWKVLHKYMDRGFTIALNEYPKPHTCGTDPNCPVTLRTTDDKGCLYVPFPPWPYGDDVESHPPLCWSLGRTGCPQGILSRNGSTMSLATQDTHSVWHVLMRNYIARTVPPTPSP
ncbi:hypothetical protein B0H13DRAFT_1886480 [Mycena leptocephala]|nr:hypothetical protein B0H13DRAFT_1886480 [Mycena leptocephala]